MNVDKTRSTSNITRAAMVTHSNLLRVWKGSPLRMNDLKDARQVIVGDTCDKIDRATETLLQFIGR